MKRLGILGGFGAAAGLQLAQHVVTHYQQRGAVFDSDFPEFVLLNLPAKGMDELGFSDSTVDGVKEQIKNGLKILNAAGCAVAVIGCNTVHAFFTEVSSKFRGNLLHIVSIACEKVRGKTVGVLASDTTKRLGVYERSLSLFQATLVPTSDSEQEIINRIIGSVICGKQDIVDCVSIYNIVAEMKARGAEVVILGCTELPLALRPEMHFPLPVIDSGLEAINAAIKLL